MQCGVEPRIEATTIIMLFFTIIYMCKVAGVTKILIIQGKKYTNVYKLSLLYISIEHSNTTVILIQDTSGAHKTGILFGLVGTGIGNEMVLSDGNGDACFGH